MILIECFTESHIDNLAACLRLQPETVVMVGKQAEMEEPVRRYQKLLSDRGQNTCVKTCDVGDRDLAGICAALEKLLRVDAEFVIDMTGGEELVIMAVGAVLTQLDADKRRHIRVEKYSHRKGNVVDCVHNNRSVSYPAVGITVQELVELHGGKLMPGYSRLPKNFDREELDNLWELVRQDPKGWNEALGYLNEFESKSDTKDPVELPLKLLHLSIDKFEKKEKAVRELLEKLDRAGCIEDLSSRDELKFRYRSEVVRYCLRKAGNVLELKTLAEGCNARKGEKPLFQDCLMSVSIDWDGVFHKITDKDVDTRNEIDVMLMHGLTPLFISCKNGGVGEDELYKLHTVAERFGGPYARKLLVVTELCKSNERSERAFGQRAEDMGIELVTNGAKLSPEEWEEELQNAIR